MDLSPLPHKAAFSVTTEVEPTPEIVSLEECKTPTTEVVQDSLMEGLQQPAPQE